MIRALITIVTININQHNTDLNDSTPIDNHHGRTPFAHAWLCLFGCVLRARVLPEGIKRATSVIVQLPRLQKDLRAGSISRDIANFPSDIAQKWHVHRSLTSGAAWHHGRMPFARACVFVGCVVQARVLFTVTERLRGERCCLISCSTIYYYIHDEYILLVLIYK